MNKPFVISDADYGLVITLIKEANIILASLDENTAEYQTQYYRYKDCIDVMRAIERTEPQHDDDINFILKTINTIWEKGILSPLTLADDEFTRVEGATESYNKRYRWIVKRSRGIYNNAAYKATIRKVYNHRLGIEVKCDIPPVNLNPVLYVSKGGIITGEYICMCEIRPDVVAKHSFVIQSIVNIPASAISVNNRLIIVVDHREPKLKALKEFYDVPVGFDEEVKNLKLNIRKYKKL